MTHRLEEVVEQYLIAQQLTDQNLLVAVSGGADSVALLRGLQAIQHRFSFALFVAHFNHKLRGSASDEDAEFVRRLCSGMNVPFEIGSSRTKSVAKQPSEMQLRTKRYHFLQQTADKLKCPHVLLAHHADDQVETLLHHIARGSGLRGLAGIPQQRSLTDQIRLERPLLNVFRCDILEYLKNLGQAYRIDASNENVDYTRNLIRHQLVPLLQKVNSNASENLLSLSQQAAERLESEFPEVSLLKSTRLIFSSENRVRLHVTHLQNKADWLLRELLMQIWIDQNWPRGKMTAEDWQRLAELVKQTEGSIDLPQGLKATRRAEMLVVER